MSRPRKQDALNIPERAVAVTINLLRHDGPTFVLTEVARRIGCSAPALYAHFSGKDHLLREVQAAVFAQMTRSKVDRYAAPSADPIGRLAAGGHAFIDFAQDSPGLYRLLYAPNHPAGPEPVAIPDAALAALESGVRAAQQMHFAAGAEPRAVAEMLWFTVHGAVLMALDEQLPGPQAARWARAHRAVDTVMALLSPSVP